MTESTLNVIRDQRTMIGGLLCATPEEVEAAWQTWVSQNGLPSRKRLGDNSTDLRTSRKTLQAYISGGKWMADCPACNDGIACWPENPRGCCLGCGTIYKIDYPSADEIARAEQTLGQRPLIQTRNWLRHQGETIDELEKETADRLDEEAAQGVVAADDIARVLGARAVTKLRKEGVL